MSLIITSPLRGWATTLDSVPDPVFAQRMMGDGVAIQPLGDTIVAPFDGEVVTLHDAGHAISLRSAEGAEILIHIGLDTVMLKGEGFTPLVAIGQIEVEPVHQLGGVGVQIEHAHLLVQGQRLVEGQAHLPPSPSAFSSVLPSGLPSVLPSGFHPGFQMSRTHSSTASADSTLLNGGIT